MLSQDRLHEIAARYAGLHVALVGDFCLDRYLEIDPGKAETSIETGLPVHNVVRVRAQPGGAGTILNNLVALGVGAIYPLGFCGDDGEGYELRKALAGLPGVHCGRLLSTSQRRTFTYCKPLVVAPGQPPIELNRLDSKNWTPTPREVEGEIIRRLQSLAPRLDAVVLMDQVDIPETGVVMRRLLDTVATLSSERPRLWILADSRRGLAGFPPICFKMNRAELCAFMGSAESPSVSRVQELARECAMRQGRHVFVTLSEAGIVGAAPDGQVEHVSSLPLRGAIDVVGAGDCVTANLVSAMAAGATLAEAIELANAAASVVLHKLGTTGSASVAEIAEQLR